MSIATLNDIFFAIVSRDNPRVTLHRQDGGWVATSSRQLYRNVSGTARKLLNWTIAKGDRVAILGENRPEWTTADFACQLIGAVSVPIYSTLTAQQTQFILQDAGCRVIFLSTEAQLRKLESIRAQTPVEKVVVMDPVESTQAFGMAQLMREGPENGDPGLDAGARRITSDDLATIIYTSGTTGVPKGVMLTHGNLASNIEYSLKSFEFPGEQVSRSFLPLSH